MPSRLTSSADWHAVTERSTWNAALKQRNIICKQLPHLLSLLNGRHCGGTERDSECWGSLKTTPHLLEHSWLQLSIATQLERLHECKSVTPSQMCYATKH